MRPRLPQLLNFMRHIQIHKNKFSHSKMQFGITISQMKSKMNWLHKNSEIFAYVLNREVYLKYLYYSYINIVEKKISHWIPDLNFPSFTPCDVK